MSPILFLLYILKVFQTIEHQIPNIQIISYIDDLGLIAQGRSVDKVCRQLKAAAKAAVEWGHANSVEFNPKKTEATLFTRKTGKQLKDQIQRARVSIAGASMAFRLETTK